MLACHLQLDAIHTHENSSQFYNYTVNYGRPLILLKTHVVLVRVACGSNIHMKTRLDLLGY